MPPPEKPSGRFSFFGISAGRGGSYAKTVDPPQLKLEPDREVYRPGDLVTVTLKIKNPSDSFQLLIERLSFEIKGIEKLDTNWFSTPKPSSDRKQRRGEYVFMEWSAPAIISNEILASGATKRYVVRTLLPNIIPPSYRGATIRYLYYIRSTLSGQYLMLNENSSKESKLDLRQLEARVPLQIWVTQKTNGLLNEEDENDGIVPTETILLEVYLKEMGGDSEWIKANEIFDGVEEGYESSRDEILSVSSYNPIKEDMHKAFGSSLSLQSSFARSSSKDLINFEGRASISSHLTLPRLSVAEAFHDSSGGKSPSQSASISSSIQQLSHPRSLPTDDETRMTALPGIIESGASEGFVRGRSYNIRLDDQVLLRFSPKNSDSTYYFSDVIGGTLTFFHEEESRRCLELSITLEMTETINRRFVHPSRRHSPTITKVHSDHHQVVADLVQTSFLFSIPMDGPMSFSTRYVSIQWALRFEFLTTPKNVDWTRYEHPLLVEGRDKCEWILPITIHAPPLGAAATQIRNERSFSLEPLWTRT